MIKENYRQVRTHSELNPIPLAQSLLSAGEAFEISEDYDLLDVNFAITKGRDGFIAFPVTGESMLPHIRNGDIVFVDTWAVPRNGDTVVANVNGQNNIKVFQQTHCELYLVPKNGDYRTRQIKDTDTLYIVGVVRAHLAFD